MFAAQCDVFSLDGVSSSKNVGIALREGLDQFDHAAPNLEVCNSYEGTVELETFGARTTSAAAASTMVRTVSGLSAAPYSRPRILGTRIAAKSRPFCKGRRGSPVLDAVEMSRLRA